MNFIRRFAEDLVKKNGRLHSRSMIGRRFEAEFQEKSRAPRDEHAAPASETLEVNPESLIQGIVVVRGENLNGKFIAHSSTNCPSSVRFNTIPERAPSAAVSWEKSA